jgi:hypothetical protein
VHIPQLALNLDLIRHNTSRIRWILSARALVLYTGGHYDALVSPPLPMDVVGKRAGGDILDQAEADLKALSATEEVGGLLVS